MEETVRDGLRFERRSIKTETDPETKTEIEEKSGGSAG